MAVDYSQPLTEHDVTVTMARQPHPDGPREVRHFTFTIPAASPSEAAYGAIQMGYGINEASGYQWKLADDEDGPRVRPAIPRPTITVLCGSTRFKDAWYQEGRRLTHAGVIVLSVGDLDTSSAARTANMPIDPELKARLDELHKRKIDLADEVLILNVAGYIGDSTRSEIEYAEKLGKPVRYLEPVSRPDTNTHGSN